MLCKIYLGFILSVKVMDAFWNGKIFIGIDTRIKYIIAIISRTLSLHCLYLDPQIYKFPINI